MTDLPNKWKKSEKSLRAVQLAFEFNQHISDSIRTAASRHGLSPSDQIREVIGLKAKKPLRPRLTVSLSAQDYEHLGKRYGLSPDDKAGIRSAISEELIHFSQIENDKPNNKA
ncbi:hypothetical protein [Candidatus Venteria ishoeyi]|uniref:Uncharacterized protein n=1 Tax=Candidatus Venteria ishoeyi TaxID=1899563 RepID=A0A1H6FAV3_9GAMM|nr:hypothetical protein [Candidatus Venteria ishoeyi]MDM8545334.1 hypothetical protein [Candidatus Venteria ishoeyi]SEH07217.1 Uncharacterised protein [Candidatus Venteria ishoeyi]